MGEFELIARLASYLDGEGDGVAVGHGDDAAVLAVGGNGVVVTVDALVEGVHFRRDLSSLADVGWKAVAVNASDIAAMGAQPLAAVVALCRPAGLEQGGVEELYGGMRQACDRWNMRLVGGDTVASGELVLSVTALGRTHPGAAVRRSGARPGDRVVVVGALGAAAAALAQVAAGDAPDPPLLAAHRRPVALVDAGQALARAGATALIDVSDGLGADLARICTASGVGAVVRWAALPVAPGAVAAVEAAGADVVGVIAGGGEDFALLATLPPAAAERAAAAAGAVEGVPAAVIGEVVDAPGARLLLEDGTECDLAPMGYDHYDSRRT
ncbi:MAG TPA: thiamine-phosphate kinase [Egibacteraceae bacterium]|jgi:thiamine-monophosphate kinase|nr:thiamine-phosphate kinase [Egibacteraceae bacterium]